MKIADIYLTSFPLKKKKKTGESFARESNLPCFMLHKIRFIYPFSMEWIHLF